TDLSERDELLRSERAARAQLEAALQQLAERQTSLRRVIDSNIFGVVFGAGDRITDANDEFLRLVGFSRAELQAGNFSIDEIRSQRRRETDRAAFARCLADEVCPAYE